MLHLWPDLCMLCVCSLSPCVLMERCIRSSCPICGSQLCKSVLDCAGLLTVHANLQYSPPHTIPSHPSPLLFSSPVLYFSPLHFPSLFLSSLLLSSPAVQLEFWPGWGGVEWGGDLRGAMNSHECFAQEVSWPWCPCLAPRTLNISAPVSHATGDSCLS